MPGCELKLQAPGLKPPCKGEGSREQLGSGAGGFVVRLSE